MKYLLWFGLGLVALWLLVAGTTGPSPEQKARRTLAGAIELCWQDQARKSLEPAEARLIAGACEKLEADYRARYGRNP